VSWCCSETRREESARGEREAREESARGERERRVRDARGECETREESARRERRVRDASARRERRVRDVRGENKENDCRALLTTRCRDKYLSLFVKVGTALTILWLFACHIRISCLSSLHLLKIEYKS
jgi:hypothetical protein